MFLKHVTEDKVEIFFFDCSKCTLKIKRIHIPFKMWWFFFFFLLPTDNVGTSISQGRDKKQKYPLAPMFLFNIVSQFIISSQGV